MFKKILFALLLIVFTLGIYYHELVSYGYMQAKGQLSILFNTKPIPTVLEDPTLPDSLKQRLRLIGEIKRFAVDSLGLDASGSYEDFFDQHGKPILWVITASEKYRLIPKQWRFPIIGTFTYKGFFDSTRAQKEEQALINNHFDTQINEVSAWSTLGFLNDPVLSSMLYRSEGSLANLIIHEMTHGTLFVKDNLELNENLANFIGDYGAIRFLTYKYGQNKPPLEKYEFRKQYNDAISQHIVRGANQLDSLYKTFSSKLTTAQKDTLKTRAIHRIVISSDTLLNGLVGKKYPWRSKKLPNNAFFIGYLTYHSQQNNFQREFKEKFNSDFNRYLAYLKIKYPTTF
ncbi:MAG: aminopeptidase [Spirosomataceae bacterium]